MVDLNNVLYDPELGGTVFSVMRQAWEKVCGEVKNAVVELHRNMPGNIQPAASVDRELFPQEARWEDLIQVLAAFPFTTGAPDEGDGIIRGPDMILHGGRRYRVIRVKDWESAGGYYKAWAVLAEEE